MILRHSITKEFKNIDSFDDNWSQLGIDLDGQSDDHVGWSVALSSDGTIVAVGAYNHDNTTDSNEGTVRVYKFDGSSWNRLGAEGELDGEQLEIMLVLVWLLVVMGPLSLLVHIIMIIQLIQMKELLEYINGMVLVGIG